MAVIIKIIAVLENLSKHLQAVNVTAEMALFNIQFAKQRITDMRNDSEFDKIMKEVKTVKHISNNFDDEVQSTESKTPRKRKLARVLDDDALLAYSCGGIGNILSATNSGECGIADLKRQFFEAIDITLQSLNKRFEQNDVETLKSVEDVLTSAANKSLSDSSFNIALAKNEGPLVVTNIALLSKELAALPTIISLYNATASLPVKNVTDISTICNVFNALPGAKLSLPNIHLLLRIYCSIPMASATAERTFSTMRRMKSWLRANSDNNHLNCTMFANIHQSRLDDVCLEDVAKEFVQKNDVRKAFFGKI